MKKYIPIIIIIVGIAAAAFLFLRSPAKTSTTTGEDSTPQSTRIKSEPKDFESYTSTNFGFTMDIPKSITTTASTSEGFKEREDSVMVRENTTKGIVYVVAQSNLSVLSESGELIPENVPAGEPVYISSFFVRPLEKWENVGALIGGLLKENVPAAVDLGEITFVEIQQHPGTNVYTALFTSEAVKDEKGELTPLPVNFIASFSSEHKKVAIWLVGQDYVFGKTVSPKEYKIFDEDIISSVKFVK